MRYVLGVDAGNTKTIALLARADGTIVGSGRSGCGDIYGAASSAAALSAIDAAVGQALAAAGLAPAALAAGAFSLAGADWPEDFELLEGAMRARGYGRTTLVVNDALGALRAAIPGNVGVAVVCGTGAAIGARGPDGRVWHTSFWGEPQGAGELGERALRAVYRAELAIDPPTALTDAVLRYVGVPDVETLLHELTRREHPRPSPARELARVLLDTAARGDATAQQIVRAHGAALGDYALVAARRVGLGAAPYTLALAGGVLRHPSPLLRDALVTRVRAATPAVHVVHTRREPAVGALLLALEQAGVAVDAAVDAAIDTTLPPPALFAT